MASRPNQPTKRGGTTSERIGAIRRLLTTLIAATIVLSTTALPAYAWTRPQLRTYQLIPQYWPKRYQQARRVAWCESSGTPTATNPYSGAAGVFQLMPYWWQGGNAYGWRFDPYKTRKNLFYAHLLFRRSGFTWRQWACQPW